MNDNIKLHRCVNIISRNNFSYNFISSVHKYTAQDKTVIYGTYVIQISPYISPAVMQIRTINMRT